jgi:hypothetical protein
MDEDLELYIGARYTIALVVFFPPYMLFELPSNIVLRKVGSANWLSFIAFAWGCVMLGQVGQLRVSRQCPSSLLYIVGFRYKLLGFGWLPVPAWSI